LAAELDDAAAVIRDLAEASEEDPERLAEVSARRKALSDLCRKYGPLLADVLEYSRATTERLNDLLGYEQRARDLEASIAAANDRVRKAEAVVRKKRIEGAPQFAKAVQKHLRLLALPEAVFQVDFAPESQDPSGDGLNFLLSANPGSPPLPLSKVASGGELARVMLALRLVLTQSPPTLIFDEVDAGIGGAAAVAVGKALAAVAKGHQVFVVTHLAQVASQAHQQLGVSKEIVKKVTFARVGELTGAARESEIARMLSGGALTEVAVAHAQELLTHSS
jgi:DNA repair protein RecN (Recombination protein N)